MGEPKKDGNKENGKGKDNNNGGDDGKQEKKKESKDKNSKNKSDEKKTKEKELPVTTAVLRVQLHWYQDMKIDKQKELVTVTGAMDMTALAAVLKKHLKKEVEILPLRRKLRRKRKEVAKRKGRRREREGRRRKGEDRRRRKGEDRRRRWRWWREGYRRREVRWEQSAVPSRVPVPAYVRAGWCRRTVSVQPVCIRALPCSPVV
ncbi:hypothetical protein DH2020_000268 [Rehmannia glutinosa]|uniref:Uncharacterized protein n=1 Tax=Rehmannia glutinosa TaxID=99300 RepID=A0ABR0XWB9_REHGL